MTSFTRKARVFWPLLLVVLLADCTTKNVAVQSLSPGGPPHSVVGETLRFNLTYNDRGAMGLPLGPLGKEALGLFGVVVAGFFFAWYRRGRPEDVLLASATSLYIAGDLGNGWERIVSHRGVVDFIDLGLGPCRFWTFNVADVALTVAAGLLLLLFVREERKERPPRAAF